MKGAELIDEVACRMRQVLNDVGNHTREFRLDGLRQPIIHHRLVHQVRSSVEPSSGDGQVLEQLLEGHAGRVEDSGYIQ